MRVRTGIEQLRQFRVRVRVRVRMLGLQLGLQEGLGLGLRPAFGRIRSSRSSGDDSLHQLARSQARNVQTGSQSSEDCGRARVESEPG